MGFFDKMFSGLTKTRKNIEDLEEVFRNYDIDSEDFYDELEEMLIMADVGGETTAQIMMDYKRILLRRYINKGKAAKEAFVGYMQDMLGNMDTKLKLDTKPSVILMVGVNGVGKTTTIGKLSASLKAEGKNVLLWCRRYLPRGSSRAAGRLGRALRSGYRPPRGGQRSGSGGV